jgi:DNA-binding NarL/FixJ family response regulator
MAKERVLNRRKILIVDDHPFVREGLRTYIEQQPDFEVCAEAGTAAEALRAWQRRKPDLAMVELSLNGSSGLDLIRQLRDLDTQTPILVLSMHEESLHSEQVLRAGAQGYIMKREDPARVLTAMRQVLAGRCYLSEQMEQRMLRRYVGSETAEQGAREPAARLTDREAQVLQLLGQGHRRGHIAQKLHLSVKTVETHCQRLKEKLGLGSADELRLHAFAWARQDAPPS